MTNRSMRLKTNAISLLAGGLVLAGLLGACSKVNVTVDACATRTGTTTHSGNDGAGGCTASPPLTTEVNARGFLDMSNSNLPIQDDNHVCKVGQYTCQSGKCLKNGQFKSCVVWFQPDPLIQTILPTKGLCNCGCPP
jgi:hypothetical protein